MAKYRRNRKEDWDLQQYKNLTETMKKKQPSAQGVETVLLLRPQDPTRYNMK